MPQAKHLDGVLYYFLSAVTKGEALDIVRNVNEECGSEAWRKLCLRFGRKSMGKRVALTRRVVNPSKVKKIENLYGAVERWESDITRLIKDYQKDGETLMPNGLKCGILLEMVPSALSEKIVFSHGIAG